MTKTLIVIAIIALIIYCYWKQKAEAKNHLEEKNWLEEDEVSTYYNFSLFNLNQENQISSDSKEWIDFMKPNLNSSNLEELKTKLNGKTLDELIEENSDWETEVDTLTRTKNSLEADLLAQSNAFQNRLREKDREVKKLKEELTNSQSNLNKLREELTSEKQQHKGSLNRINKLSEQLTNLKKEHQSQLRAINCLFDPSAKDYQEIDFNGLYGLLEKIAQRNE